MTHALRMGREYTEPFQGFGKGDKHEISSLCKRPSLATPLCHAFNDGFIDHSFDTAYATPLYLSVNASYNHHVTCIMT